jgi:hypothetical protein
VVNGGKVRSRSLRIAGNEMSVSGRARRSFIIGNRL